MNIQCNRLRQEIEFVMVKQCTAADGEDDDGKERDEADTATDDTVVIGRLFLTLIIATADDAANSDNITHIFTAPTCSSHK